MYCMKHLPLIHCRGKTVSETLKRHGRAFSRWFKAQVYVGVDDFKKEYMQYFIFYIIRSCTHSFQVISKRRESSNIISQDLFSLAIGPSLEVNSYSGCIISGVRFHKLERVFQRTTQNSGVMLVGEGSGGGVENNFYGVLDEVLHIQYPFG